MIMTRCLILFAAALALAACARPAVSEMPAAATPGAAPAAGTAASTAESRPLNPDGTPLERTEANAQCWMRYDKTNVPLEAKAKLVEKCANDKMAGVDSKETPKKKPAR